VTSAVFARHETFHPRFSWLKKGFDQAQADPEAFIHSDAHVRLGVGKNMVRSIRYWCHAFKVLQDDTSVGGRATGSKPTEFGLRLLDDTSGWDPFLEDPASLWLLHWKLLSEPCEATAWWYAFFLHAGAELSADELTKDLKEYVDKNYPTARTAESSLKKDASCIIRMYGVLPSTSGASEESIQCPFAELGLLRPGSRKGVYGYRVGRKLGLPSRVIVAACLDFAESRSGGTRRTISLSSLAHEAGSPGLALKLSESALYQSIEEVAEVEPGIRLSEAAGLVQLSYSGGAPGLSHRLITAHYDQRVEALA
jgi:hypothetical protein